MTRQNFPSACADMPDDETLKRLLALARSSAV
jgi:hypothetical protein